MNCIWKAIACRLVWKTCEFRGSKALSRVFVSVNCGGSLINQPDWQMGCTPPAFWVQIFRNRRNATFRRPLDSLGHRLRETRSAQTAWLLFMGTFELRFFFDYGHKFIFYPNSFVINKITSHSFNTSLIRGEKNKFITLGLCGINALSIYHVKRWLICFCMSES